MSTIVLRFIFNIIYSNNMENSNTIKIFGHKVPDTDTVVSAISYAWYYNNVKKQIAKAYVLGELNKETKYVLDKFGIETPDLLGEINKGDQIVIVDTNNLDELPEGVKDAELIEIIDHHKLFGGFSTSSPVTVTLRVMASTASLIYTVMNPELHGLPKDIAGIMLCALISDTLEFRSPTTTNEDREIGEELARISGADISELAKGMFEAKSDISDISTKDLIVMDSKIFDLKGKKTRVSVIETTNPKVVIDRLEDIKIEMKKLIAEDSDTEDFLLFVIDILNESALPVFATDTAKETIEKAFNVTLSEVNDTILPGIVSRKKQIIPALEA